MKTAIRASALLVLLLALPALASPERTAQEIRLTLREMERAVLGADQVTYLAQVDTSDAVFLQEQRAWAADLGRHAPVDFSLTLDEAQLVESDGWAEAPLTMRWRMDGPRIDTREPEARQISFTALFAEKIDEPGRWRFAGRKWGVRRAEGIRALCAPGLEEVGQMVVDVFPEVQQAVEAEYGVHVATEQTVKIYSAMADLQASIYLSYTDGLAGWNEPGESIKILAGRRTSRDGLRPLLAHEFGHVITFELGVDSDAVAWWILEGVAEVAAEAVGQRGSDRLVQRWAENDQLADWNAISDFRTTEGRLMRHVYSQGASMVRYITREYGAEKRLAWLKRLAAGDSLDDASRAAFGAPFEQIDRAWRESLR
ncbi:MAG: peptidase MA family metallohydrolase [Phycisphaerales bacterium JB039]